MSRWKVERWADPNVAAWVAWDEEAPDRMMLFSTHAEALDYADKKARTREFVLPRLRPHGELTVSATWRFDSLVVHIDASGQTVQGTPADLARHAATLLALAEQEGAREHG